MHACFRLAISPYVDTLVFLAIVANTITLSMDSYGAPLSMTSSLNTANVVFTAVFAAELVVKLIGGYRAPPCCPLCPGATKRGGRVHEARPRSTC